MIAGQTQLNKNNDWITNRAKEIPQKTEMTKNMKESLRPRGQYVNVQCIYNGYQKKKKENIRKEVIFEETVARNFPEVMKDMSCQI